MKNRLGLCLIKMIVGKNFICKLENLAEFVFFKTIEIRGESVA